MQILLEAVAYATKMHAGQVRKYTHEPYVLHCLDVARIVLAVAPTDERLACAAVLHDVVEDTAATLSDVRDRFGFRVADLVGWVTDVSRPEDGNRAARKAKDREHLAAAPGDAQTIKLADLISNTRSITEHDPKFAKVLLAEKQELLKVLTLGSPRLHELARRQVERA